MIDSIYLLQQGRDIRKELKEAKKLYKEYKDLPKEERQRLKQNKKYKKPQKVAWYDSALAAAPYWQLTKNIGAGAFGNVVKAANLGLGAYKMYSTSMNNYKRNIRNATNRVNKTSLPLYDSYLSSANEMINKWKNLHLKNRLDNTILLTEMYNESIKRQNERLDKIRQEEQKRTEELLKQNSNFRPPPKPDEFGNVVDPITRTIYKPFKYSNYEHEPTTKEKQKMYFQNEQKRVFNKQYYIENMERIKETMNNPNSIIADRVKYLPEEYKNLSKNESHDLLSHNAEYMFKDATEKANWDNAMRIAKLSLPALFDAVKVGAEKGSVVSGAVAGLKSIYNKLFGNKTTPDDEKKIQALTIELQNKAKKIEEAEKKVDKTVEFYNANKDLIMKAVKDKNFDQFKAIELPNYTLEQILNDKGIQQQFIKDYENLNNVAEKYVDTINVYLKWHPNDQKAKEIKENLKNLNIEKDDRSVFQKTFDKAKDFINTETGKMIKNTAEQQLGGKTSEEIEMEAVMNGDIYDDKYRETPIDSFNHLTLSEKFDYLRNNKEITKEMKNLRWKDVGALYSMKMDWRIKNENIKSEVIRKAHKAFIQGDDTMKKELSIYGINSIDDVRKRRNDIYETLVLSGNDASKIDEILDEQALQTPENYEKNVLRPLNELKTKHKLDKAESLTNKIFEIASAVKKNQDVKQQLLMYALNDMDSKEGTTAEANNNRVRDLVEKAIPYNNKLSADNRNPNKIKNILIVRLTSLLSQGGFLSADEERELMKDEKLGNSFFMHPEGGTIFDAKHLQTEADIKKAFNRIDNYIGWRDNYIKLTGKMRTQKTFDEVGTSNTGQNPLTKTPGQKYLDIDDIVKRSVFDDDDDDDELDTVNLYEKNKRTSTIRSLLEENPTKLSMMFNEIEDPKYLSLSTSQI